MITRIGFKTVTSNSSYQLIEYQKDIYNVEHTANGRTTVINTYTTKEQALAKFAEIKL